MTFNYLALAAVGFFFWFMCDGWCISFVGAGYLLFSGTGVIQISGFFEPYFERKRENRRKEEELIEVQFAKRRVVSQEEKNTQGRLST